MDFSRNLESSSEFPLHKYVWSANTISQTDLALINEEEQITDNEQIIEQNLVVNDAYVTVKFRVSKVDIVTRKYPYYFKLADIKKDISKKYDIDEKELTLYQCGIKLTDECRVWETACNDYGIHEFYLDLGFDNDGDSSSESIRGSEMDLNVIYDTFSLPKLITVHISGEKSIDSQPKDVKVEIQNKAIVKPFLCGYRDKITGIRYFDAFTQTGPYFDYWLHRRLRTRQTQTVELKEALSECCPRDKALQCVLIHDNIWFNDDKTKDVILTPRKYEKCEEEFHHTDKLQKIILIQKNWRRFLCVRFMKNAALEYRQFLANQDNAIKKILEDEEALMDFRPSMDANEFTNIKMEFSKLYQEVKKWRKAEEERICTLYDGPARIAEMDILLHKEINMLRKVDEKHTKFMTAYKPYLEENALKKLGKPITWIGYNDKIIQLDLQRNQRARFLFEIYTELKQKKNKKDRLELIDKVKHILIDEDDFPDIITLYDLLEREKNLLTYTLIENHEILHKRQLALFSNLIKYSREPPKRQAQTESSYRRMCRNCLKLKTILEFDISTKKIILDLCKPCSEAREMLANRKVYQALLHAIQRDERRKRCNSSVAFIMQIEDLRFLIDKIWHIQSILTPNNDLKNLRFPRWIKSEDWAPWNCVCLTVEEARNHCSLRDPKSLYSQSLINVIESKHLLAKNIFRFLINASTVFLEKRQFFKVGLTRDQKANFLDLYETKCKK